MYDAGKIITGLVVFLILATTPVWYNLARGGSGEAPEMELPVGKGSCVEGAAHMRSAHMNLLDQWRDEVVRNENRIYVSQDGREFEMSLTKTCLGCHDNKQAFCDRCHDYTQVDPYCWGCHIVPGGDNR
jgi:hypothetical protein